ncbi:MAG: sugar ABC transporter substrate-binding protein [Chloroflexi bacterium]|nr:sugar ABC transporter substrate-binding protein [Chloroflexota bacterium]
MSDTESRDRKLSRRSLLKLAAAFAGTAVGGGLLSACSSSPAPSAPAGGAATAPAGGGATAAPAAQAAATSAPAVVKGQKLTIWMGQSFLESLDKQLGSMFGDYGKTKGIEVDYQIVPSAQLPQKLAAAIQGKNPPDIAYLYDSDTQYYRSQNQLVDVTEVWDGLKKKGGEVYAPAADTSNWQGKAWSIPVVINPWPIHARKDLLDKAGLKYPENWDSFIEACKKIQNPPQLYGYGLCLGKNDDANDNIIQIMWTYGAQMQTKDNKPAFNSPETRKAFQMIADMYTKHKIIPPGAINWDNAGNNNAYQAGQAVFVANPSSVLAWLQANKPDLAKATVLENVPAGPVGSFGEVDCWALGVFKDSKVPDAARDALAYVMDPDHYSKFIDMAAGRYVPIYKKLTDTKFWKEDPYYHTYPNMAETGRIMAYTGQPTGAFGEVMRQYVLTDAIQAVIVQGQSVDEAINAADKKIQEIYKKNGMI